MKRIIVAGLVLSLSVQARDLSNGIVFPSSNSAVIQNPAGLGRLKSTSFDGGIFEDHGYQGGLVSYVGNVNGSLGVGFDARRLNVYSVYDIYADYLATSHGTSSVTTSNGTLKAWENQVTGAIGFKANSFFTFGLGLQYFPGATASSGITINAGAQIAVSEKLGLGLVAYDIQNVLAHWAAGAGMDLVDGMVTGEVDLDFYGQAQSFAPSFVGITPALLFSTKKVSLKLAYRAEAYPTMIFPTDSPTIDVAFQISQNTAIYANYNDVPTKFLFGLKIRR